MQQADDDDMPDDALCLMNLEVMQVPMLAGDGHTYERSAIKDCYQRGNSISPKTQAIGQQLVPNHTVKSMIKEFL
jgi:hypothetical protein